MFLQPAQAQVKVIDGDSILIGKREIRLSGLTHQNTSSRATMPQAKLILAASWLFGL